MTHDTFDKRLAPITPRQESKTTALIEEYVKDLDEVYTAALVHAQSNGSTAAGALSVLSQLAETAVGPLAAAIPAQKPDPSTTLLIHLANGIAFAEDAVTGRLKATLSDARRVPQPLGLLVLEEVGPPHRVCDEAYTALRRILNPESLQQHLLETRHFLSLSDADKSHEIESCRKTGAFTRYLVDIDEE